MAEEPPYLAVGTEVSAKYKGAFCEAKIRKVVRSVKCKVTFKLPGIGSITVPDDQVKGQIRNGATVEVKHPDRKEVLEATITKVQDCSQYTVVFDDGDITTLRRTALCLKSGRHFAESETLDQLPLTHPEHFSNPVIGGRRGRRRGGIGEASEDEEAFLNLKDYVDIKEEDIGRVVCVEGAEKKKQKDNWFPALVVAPTAQDQSPIDIRLEYLVRSFKDGRYYTVPKKEAQQFTREIGSKVETTVLKTAVEKALLFLDKDELPPHWDRDSLFGQNEFPGTDSEAGLDYESSDDEPREEKDHFVAQLYKFMDDSGTPINKGPIICNQDVDLYKLFKVVQNLGGFNRVSNHNNWKLVSNKMGFGQNPATVNLVKQSYKKFLYSFEEFYRKLGCTMVNHPRTSRTRTRSTRSLIRDRDKAVKVEPKPETKEKKRRSSTTSISIKVEPSETHEDHHKINSPVTSKEKATAKVVPEKCIEEIKIKEEPPDLDVLDVHDQHQTNESGVPSTKPQSPFFAKSESHSEINGVCTINPALFIPAVGVAHRRSPILKNEILTVKKNENPVISKPALKVTKKSVRTTKTRRMASSALGIYANFKKGRRRSSKCVKVEPSNQETHKTAKKNPDTILADDIRIKQEPLDQSNIADGQIDIKKLQQRKPRTIIGRSESVKELNTVPHRNLETIVPPITAITKKVSQNPPIASRKMTEERMNTHINQNETKTEKATSSLGTHEIVEKRKGYISSDATMPFPMPIRIKVEPPDAYEQWYSADPPDASKEKASPKKVPDVPPVEEVKIKQEPPEETDVNVEPKEIKKTRQRKTSDSIVGKSELSMLPTRNRRIFTDTVTTRLKKDKPKPLAVNKEKSPVAPRLKRQTIKDQFKMKNAKGANSSLSNHENAEKVSKGKAKDEHTSTRVKKDDTGHTVGSDEKKKGRKRRERNEFFDMGFEPLPCYKTINVGDKLKVYYGPKHDLKVTYEAKVLSIRQEGSDTVYLVHYYGWNTRYDEWIKHSRIADNMSSGRITKKSLQASHINGRRRATQTRTPVRVDPDIIVIPDDPKTDNLQTTPPAAVKLKGTRFSTRTANKRQVSISENEDNEADLLSNETSSRKKLILDTHELTESTPNDRRCRKRKSVESEEREKSEDEHDLFKSKSKKKSLKKSETNSKGSAQETTTQEKSVQVNSTKEAKEEIIYKKTILKSTQEPTILERTAKKDEDIKTVPIKIEPPSPTMPDESPINFEGFDQSSDEEFSLYLDEDALDNSGSESKKESLNENEKQEILNEKVEAPISKGCDYDLNEIRSQLKGIETAANSSLEIKVEPKEEPEEITVEEVQDVPSEAEGEDEGEEVEEDVRELVENIDNSQGQPNAEISVPIKQEVEDVYEFKEPEPFEFESRKIDEKNKLQRRSLNRYIEENKLSPQRKKEIGLSPTYSSTRFTLPEDNLITVQKEKDIPVSEFSTFQTCEEAFDKICASPLRAANEAVPLFEEQVVNDHIEDNLDDDSQDRLVISERYSDNDNDTNETEQKEEIYTEETIPNKDISSDDSKHVNENEKNKEEIRDEWKDEVEDEELNVAIQRVINRDSSDDSNDSEILTNQSSIRAEPTKVESNFEISGKPNFNYQFGFSIKHPTDSEPKEQEVICEKSNEIETEEVEPPLIDDNSSTFHKVQSLEEENKEDEQSDKEEVCEVTTEEVKLDDEETQNEMTEENIIIDSEEIDVTGEMVENSEIDEETTEVVVTEPIETTDLVETEVEETEIDETTQIVEATVETIEVEETEEIAETTDIAELVTVTEEVAGTEEIVDTEEVEVMNDVDEEEDDDDDMEEVENEPVYDISYSEEKPALGVETEIAKIENVSTVKVEEEEYEVVEGIERDEEDEDVVVEVKDVLLKDDDIDDKDDDAEDKVGVIDDKDDDEDEEDEEEENLISLLCDEEIIPNSPNHQPVEIQEEEIKTSLPETKTFDSQDADNDEEIPLIEKIKETSKDKDTPTEVHSLPGSPGSTKTSRKKEKQPSASVSRNSAKKESNSKKKGSSEDNKKHRSETRMKKNEGKTCAKKGRRPRKKSEDTVGKRKYSRSTRHHGSDSDDTYENPRAGSSKDPCHRPSRNSKYNFLVKFEPEHDSNQRISLIQQSMQQLRIAYSDLKAELAIVDRRRKKIRRRERENAANRSHQYK